MNCSPVRYIHIYLQIGVAHLHCHGSLGLSLGALGGLLKLTEWKQLSGPLSPIPNLFYFIFSLLNLI